MAPSTIEIAQDINPPMEKETQNQIFVYHAVLYQKREQYTLTAPATYPSAPWKATQLFSYSTIGPPTPFSPNQ